MLLCCKNLSVLLWGPLFVGAPVRPNMLNMPKSESVNSPEDDRRTTRLIRLFMKHDRLLWVQQRWGKNEAGCRDLLYTDIGHQKVDLYTLKPNSITLSGSKLVSATTSNQLRTSLRNGIWLLDGFDTRALTRIPYSRRISNVEVWALPGCLSLSSMVMEHRQKFFAHTVYARLPMETITVQLLLYDSQAAAWLETDS